MKKNILISILFIVLLVVSVATIVVENRFCVSLVWVFGFYGITNKYSFRLLRILTGVVLPVDDGSWTELPLSQSIFHDNGKGLPERKFINSDGREAVYDGDTGALITDRQFMGTFNYVTPPTNGDSWWNWIWRGVGHGVTDVIPYIIWGN